MNTSNETPLVAAVLVTWNGIQDTLACLMSLRRLDYPSLRIVMVDNGSRDETVSIVQRYFPEVHIIQNLGNLGYVHANNQGIQKALDWGADWILLLNNDVVLACDAVRHMVCVGEGIAGAGIVGPVMQRTLRSDILDIGGDLDFRWGRVLLRYYSEDLRDREAQLIDYVWGCTLMARSEVFEGLGGLDPGYEAYFEDADFCIKARELGCSTVVALRARVTHQVGRSGDKRFAWQTYLRMRNHARFFLRFARGNRMLLILSLFLVELPLIFLRSVRVYLARKIRWCKYRQRPITLWGYEGHVQSPSEAQLREWLSDTGYSSG